MSNSNNGTIHTLFQEKYSIASSTRSSPFQNVHNETEWTIVERGKKLSKSFEKINRLHITDYKYAVNTPSSNGGDKGPLKEVKSNSISAISLTTQMKIASVINSQSLDQSMTSSSPSTAIQTFFMDLASSHIFTK